MATDARSTHALLEAWAEAAGALRASHVGAEIWFRQIPITAVVAAQAVAEVWKGRPDLAVVASHVLAEIWIPSALAPAGRRVQVSAQVV